MDYASPMEMLRVEFNGCSRQRIGPTGLDPEDMAEDRAALESIIDELGTSDYSGMDGWRRLPHDPMRTDHLDAVQATVV